MLTFSPLRCWYFRVSAIPSVAVALALFGQVALAADDSNVVARIGSDEVKTQEITPYLQNLEPRQQAALAGDPKLLDQAVESILVQRIVYKKALAEKWDQRADVAAQIERIRQAAITESYLASVSKPPTDFPSEAEVRSIYEANKAKLIVPRQVRLAQIYIALPKGVDKTAADQARAKLDATRKDLAQPGADFGSIARADSDDKVSFARGGEIGWIAESQIQPEIRSSISHLSKGTVSDPIHLNDGWHIIKVIDVRESSIATFEAVRDQLVQQLRTQKSQALRQAYLAQLLKENPVTVNPSALAQVLPLPVTK